MAIQFSLVYFSSAQPSPVPTLGQFAERDAPHTHKEKKTPYAHLQWIPLPGLSFIHVGEDKRRFIGFLWAVDKWGRGGGKGEEERNALLNLPVGRHRRRQKRASGRHDTSIPTVAKVVEHHRYRRGGDGDFVFNKPSLLFFNSFCRVKPLFDKSG